MANYDFSDKEQLLDYAKMVEGLSVSETRVKYGAAVFQGNNLTEDIISVNSKGKLGQYIETEYFNKKLDSRAKADFEQAGVELKVAPLKRNEKGELRAKERIVLGIINYLDVVNETFECSHFVAKNSCILLMFYIHEKLTQYADLHFELIDIWECIKEDGPQIEADWNYIVEKIRKGKAHEISEGDTLFLGACTKGATAESSQVQQPYSDFPAHRRAFCFKIQYVNQIFSTLLLRRNNRKKIGMRFLQKGETLNAKLMNTFAPYIGKTGKELCEIFDFPFNRKNKGLYASLSRLMMGLKSKKDSYYELTAADIQIKSIRVELDGKVRESMSFKNIYYEDIIDQDWEDSDFYQELTSKFIFVIFKRCSLKDDYQFSHYLLWNMPEQDLETAKLVWEDTKQKIILGDYGHFSRRQDSPIAHVRPKGQDSYDLMRTPQGVLEKKKCFWLNNGYIRKIVYGDQH